jgi:hypothetical protein
VASRYKSTAWNLKKSVEISTAGILDKILSPHLRASQIGSITHADAINWVVVWQIQNILNCGFDRRRA